MEFGIPAVQKKGVRDPFEPPFHPSLILPIHPLILVVPTLLSFTTHLSTATLTSTTQVSRVYRRQLAAFPHQNWTVTKREQYRRE